MIIAIHAKSQANFYKYRITGILGSFYKILGTMAPSVSTVDSSVIYQLVSRTVKSVFQRNYLFFQSGCHGDDLKGRARFIGIIKAGISPHPVQKILFFSVCHSAGICVCV